MNMLLETKSGNRLMHGVELERGTFALLDILLDSLICFACLSLVYAEDGIFLCSPQLSRD